MRMSDGKPSQYNLLQPVHALGHEETKHSKDELIRILGPSIDLNVQGRWKAPINNLELKLKKQRVYLVVCIQL